MLQFPLPLKLYMLDFFYSQSSSPRIEFDVVHGCYRVAAKCSLEEDGSSLESKFNCISYM